MRFCIYAFLISLFSNSKLYYCRNLLPICYPALKNPLKIVDFQGVNLLPEYPGPEFPCLPYQNKGSVIYWHSMSYLHLFLPCFLYFDLNLSFLATLWRPENHTKNLLQKPTPSLRFYLFLFNSAKLKLFPFNNKKISLFSSFVWLFFLSLHSNTQ